MDTRVRLYTGPQLIERRCDYGQLAQESAESLERQRNETEILHKKIEQLPPLLVIESGNEILIRPNSKHTALLDCSVDVNSCKNWFAKGSTVISSQLRITRRPDLRINKITIDPQLLTVSAESNGDIKIILKPKLKPEENQRIREIFGKIVDGFEELGFKLEDANATTSAEETAKVG